MIRLTLLFLTLASLLPAAEVTLRLERNDGPNPSFTQAPSGVTEIHGPMSVRATPTTAVPAGNLVLEMEYFCAGGMNSFAVLPGPPFDSKTARYLPALGKSETWSPYVAALVQPGKPLSAGWTVLRLDLPLKPDGVLQIRNARLRPERPGEFDAKAVPASVAEAPMLEAYLKRSTPSSIERVEVGGEKIRITGKAVGFTDDLVLADVPMEFTLGGVKRYESLVPVTVSADGSFSIEVPRICKRDGRDYDRLTSRWQLFRRSADGYEAQTHGRYADAVACRAPELPPAKPKSKKGLGGWSSGRLPDELDELGISSVTVNMMVHTLVSLDPAPGHTPFQWQGRTYFADEKALAGYDHTFREAEKRGAMVSVILLVANPARGGDKEIRLLGHPGATKDGTFAMPNVTSPDGLALYGAILNLITERWSKSDGVHGRVHHWIIHNEVDAGWVWTNAGELPDIVYMDLYQRSMRLVSLIARQYDPNSRPFISLTHHWANKGEARWYGSKRMLELLIAFCRAEGDFPWALAYHPYPQGLGNPRTWEDKQPTFDFNTPKITPKNLEVLDAFMKLPALLDHGQVRPVHLSENGFNSKDYSEKSLTDQAAGMALAWKKIQSLSSIEAWQYHNWIDNRNEGGLRIGLRKFPDEPGDPLGKKPIWFLYQALGTPKEDEVASQYLPVIGVTSWDQVLHKEPIR